MSTKEAEVYVRGNTSHASHTGHTDIIPAMYETLGFRIRDLRQRKRMTQRTLAAQVRVSSSYFAHVEKGHYRPNEKTLSRIAMALDTTYEDLAVLAGYVKAPVSGPAVATTSEKVPVLTRLEALPRSVLELAERFVMSLYFTPREDVAALRDAVNRYRPLLGSATQDDLIDILESSHDGGIEQAPNEPVRRPRTGADGRGSPTAE